MIQHHPDDALLLAHAAGQLSGAFAVVVASHLESCGHCRARMGLFESLGGAVLEDVPPAELPADALARTLQAIDAAPPVVQAEPRCATDGDRPALPAGTSWPLALKGCRISRWRWIGPGMRWSRVSLPWDPEANVFLLRIGSGKKLPVHTHSGIELTQVLHGCFHDGRALFDRGDFDETDGSIRHEPTVQANGECICLAAVDGKVLFEGRGARWIGALVGL